MDSVAKRGRPPKARLEGASVQQFSEYIAAADGDAPIRNDTGPVPGDNGAALARLTAHFIATYPEAWEELRLCPLQHGIEDMAARMKGKG